MAAATIACTGQLSHSASLVRGSWSQEASSSFQGTSFPKPILGRSPLQGLKRARSKVEVAADVRRAPASHSLSLSGKEASSAALQQLRVSGAADRYTSEKSSILVIGLSVHTAPVEIREKLAIPEAEWPHAIDELCSSPHIEEAGVLSTCNRMEIYVVALSWHRGIVEVEHWLSKNSGVPVEDLTPHLFILRNRDATSHLFRVASGLESLVLGEGQILSQVKKVHEAGQTVAGFSRNLNYLFRYAITAGKRVRTEISISSGAVSVSSAAVELAQMKLPLKLGEIRVCIVGAGKMSKLLVKHLLSKGCRKMVLLNRSRERAEQLAAVFPEAEIEYQPLTKLMRCAGEAHLVFTSTASVEPLFMREQADALPPVPEEVGGKRLFVDISVPRNVGACVKDSAGSWVYNVDDLAEVVASNKEDRRRKALEALPLIDGYLDEFDSKRDGLETVPVIKALRQKVEDMRLAELQRCLKGMGEGLTKKQRQAVEDLSRGIANKLLHGPMTSLRCDAASNRTVEETLENMAALERMFDLKRGPTIR